MTISYIKGDLFEQVGYDKVFALDATFKCDVGICKKFNDIYGVENSLKAMPAEETKWKGKGYCLTLKVGTDELHALVVKALPTQVPDYAYIYQAVNNLADEIKNSGSILTRKIAFPHICCGEYDKRDWKKVEEIIKEAFSDVDCEILIVEN